MAEILAVIVEHVRQQVERRRRETPISKLRESPLFSAPVRGFASALAGNSRRIIAEVKKASPSKGLIRADAGVEEIAGAYQRGGAVAMSVLTEEDYFAGSLDDLRAVKATVALPVLRKDFVFDEYQVYESAAARADATYCSHICRQRKYRLRKRLNRSTQKDGL